MKKPHYAKIATLAAGILVAVISLSVLISWLTHNTFLLQIVPDAAPMQFNTALLFLFCAFASLLLLNGKKELGAFFAGFVCVLSVFSLLQYAFNLNFGIDELFVQGYLTTKTSHPGRMSPPTGLCFFCMSAAYLVVCLSRSERRFAFAGALSVMVFALGLGTLFAYITGAERLFWWLDLTGMAIHTASCFILLGLGFLFAVRTHSNPYLPIIFILTFGFISAGQAYSALSFGEYRSVLIQLENDAQDRVSALQKELESYNSLVKAFRAFYEGSNFVDKDEFHEFASGIWSPDKGIHAFTWSPAFTGNTEIVNVLDDVEVSIKGNGGKTLPRDDSLHFPIVYVEPFEENKNWFGYDLAQQPEISESIKLAVSSGKIVATQRIDWSFSGNRREQGFALIAPVYEDDTLDGRGQIKGVLMGAFDFATLFSGSMSHLLPVGINISVFDVTKNSEPLFLHHRPTRIKESPAGEKTIEHVPFYREIVFREIINVGNRKWMIAFTPLPSYVARYMRPWIPWGGFFVILLSSWFVAYYFWTNIRYAREVERTVRVRTRQLSQANKELKTEVEMRRVIQEELNATAALQKAILESANVTIISTDSTGIITTFNAAAERMLGYSASHVVGKLTPEIIHDKNEIKQRAQALTSELGHRIEPGFEVFVAKAKKGGADENEWTYIAKDGTRFPVLLSVTALKSVTEEVTGFLGIGYDLTKRNEAMRALRQSDERFRSAFEYSPIGIALVSRGGKWLKVNQEVCDILGYSEEELLAMNFQKVTHPDDLPADLRFVEECLEGKRDRYDMEKQYIHKSGKNVFAQLNVSVVRDETGELLYFISQIQDISEKKKYLERLAESNEELEQFAYVASHDLQEPLRKITAFGDLVKAEIETKAKDEMAVVQYVDRMRDAAMRMKQLIEDLLHYSRVGTRKNPIEKIVLSKLINEVMSDLEFRISNFENRRLCSGW